MIYLRYLASSVGPHAPGSVHVVAGGPDWVKNQVEAEIAEVFPGARSASLEDAELVVIAARSSDLARCARSAARRCRAEGLLWLYSIDTGRVDVVVPSEIARWDRRNAVLNHAVPWAKAHQARWRVIGRMAHLLA